MRPFPPIPMLDLSRQDAPVEAAIRTAVLEVLKGKRFILGPRVEALEEALARYHREAGGGDCGVVTVASGTDALHLALRALGIGPGDEVLTTPFTFFATIEAIFYVGARPIFADIDPETYCLDPQEVVRRITPRTRALLPVHLYGHPADLPALVALARERGLWLVEDCAQAFGARIQGRPVGTWGDVGCYSFFPSKNLGAYGDGGGVVTRHPQVAQRIRRLRNHGSRERYRHASVGYNSRLDELQAAVLLAKLPHIDAWNEARRLVARWYRKHLAGIPGVRLPGEREGVLHVYHQFTIRVIHREAVCRALEAAGISWAIHYPQPVHLQEACHPLGYQEGDFPRAEAAAREVLSLPIFPGLTEEEVAWIARTIGEALASCASS